MNFTVKKTAPNCSARTANIITNHGSIDTPVFMPVGTVGAVKTFSPDELKYINTEIILGNTYHLYLRPGISVINQAGGLHNFISWDRPILTDSGGFQVYSLASLNKISDEGVKFQSHIDGSKHLFTPESSMEIQRNLGSDIIMAFDDCPPGNSDRFILERTVRRTTDWMERCYNWITKNPPLYGYDQVLFPIVQGGTDLNFRKLSIDQLLNFSQCGIAIGGLAVGEEKNAMFDTIAYCDQLLPRDQPRYLMGVGKPSDIIKAVRRGIDMFDCVMPTRNGRNGHIFTSKGVINIKNERYKKDYSALDKSSSHSWGSKFSRSYVRHLFKINEILGMRIACSLNLAFYHDLMEKIRNKIYDNSFDRWSENTLLKMKIMKGM